MREFENKMKFPSRMPISIFLFVFIILTVPLGAYQTEYVVIVLIDGVRYTESLEDTTGTYMPALTALSEYAVIHDSAFNDSMTITRFGVPVNWMGRWHPLQDTTYLGNDVEFCRFPTYWEYARYDLNLPQNKAVSFTPDYGVNSWLPSFDPDYGPSYWPYFASSANYGDKNAAVFDSAITVIRREHPVISFVYLPDSDGAGHSGDWDWYLIKIRQADSLTAALWDTIQADPVMANKTTMFITNDHGRHDDAHGGFSGHGDTCFGCRHVMMFAIGPDFARGIHVDSIPASLKDIAPTAGELLGFDPVYSIGRILYELFASCDYVVGDVNNSGDFNGLDVTYGVAYFKGGDSPPYDCECPPGNIWHVSGDVNGSCDFNGLDITYAVSFFKGGPGPLPCGDCPPGTD